MVNKTVLQGRLVRDPEMRITQTSVSVTSFTVAWSEKYKETEIQLFLDCTAWRGLGEFINNYFKKGQEIVVEGRLETNKWQDKDGNNRSTIKMTVDKAHFCGPKQSGDTSNTYSPASAPVDVGFATQDLTDIDDDDLPF